MAHAGCVLNKQSYMRARTCTCAWTRMHTNEHAHTDKYAIRIVSPWQQWFRKRVPLLPYTSLPALFRIVMSFRMICPRSKHVAPLETQTLLSKHCCVLTNTNFVYRTITTQRDVTCKGHNLFTFNCESSLLTKTPSFTSSWMPSFTLSL